jgi:hypothetical protein
MKGNIWRVNGVMTEQKRDNITLEARSKSKSEINGQVLSNAAIRDELSFRLSSAATYEITKDNHIIINRKYYDRAGNILYRLRIWATPPVFVINTSDLSQQLCDELDRLKNCDPKKFNKTVTEAIESLMEGINNRYYNVSGIAYKISWRFES